LVLVIGTVKVQTELRVDKLLYARFKELCKADRLLVGEAGAAFLRACVDAGSVTAVVAALETSGVGQRKADELKLKGALANLRSFVRAVEAGRFWITVKDREVRVDQAIYPPAYEVAVATLPKIQDRQLLAAAEHVLEQANRCVETVGG
jgi:hypothetical protein